MSLVIHLTKTVTYSPQIFFTGIWNLAQGMSVRTSMGIKSGELGPVTSRREIRLVADIPYDLKRFTPAGIVMILPFYWTSPFIFRHAPGLIPKAFFNFDLLVSLATLIQSLQKQKLDPKLLRD